MNINELEIKYFDIPVIGTFDPTYMRIDSSTESNNQCSESWRRTNANVSLFNTVPSYILFNEPSVIHNDTPFYYSIDGVNLIIEVKNSLPSFQSYRYNIGTYDDKGVIQWVQNGSEGTGSGFLRFALVDTTLTGGNLKYGYKFISQEEYDKRGEYSEKLAFGYWYGLKPTFAENSVFWSTAVPLNPTPIPPNKPGGNEGDYDDDSDEIEQPILPTITPINNGMIHAYSINTEQLTSLANYLWSTDFFDNFLKVFDNPIDAILGLYQIRYPVNAGTTDNIRIGNCDSGVSAPAIANNYSIVDCGTINITEYFGNALDYSPYTKISIYLPYVGMRNLDIDYCMNASLTVRYLIDCISGSGVCYVYVSRDSLGTNLKAPLYSYPCSCNVQIPLTAYNMSNLYSSIVGGISSIVGGALSGGAGYITGTLGAVNSVLSAKNHVEKSGSISGASGLLGMQKPFVILERPVNAYAENYNKYYGLPCNMEYDISRLSGFTKISKINVTAIDKATATEKDEIEKLLKEGVIF